MKKLAFALVATAIPFTAQAQGWSQNSYGGGYTVMTPGQPTTIVSPNNSLFGGYTVMTPGQPSTIVTPDGHGSYTSMTPGKPPTYISPNPVYGR